MGFSKKMSRKLAINRMRFRVKIYENNGRTKEAAELKAKS